ncbi:hypothetical protein GCM10023220_28770 [Streptomyces ziwulingensis]|uniref:Uncharacterized protein n=1 Tax=Streptomyces ziwulingensis TaxID=1045501 RepID=A0ABP9BTD0_9ACTN
MATDDRGDPAAPELTEPEGASPAPPAPLPRPLCDLTADGPSPLPTGTLSWLSHGATRSRPHRKWPAGIDPGGSPF